MKLLALVTRNLLIALRLPASHPLWSWWNGRSVHDGRSMRYHLYHQRALRAEQSDE